MEEFNISLPVFELDADGHIQLRWHRKVGGLHATLTLDEALDLQFQLATFLAQVEQQEYQAQAEQAGCECEVPGEISRIASQHRFLN